MRRIGGALCMIAWALLPIALVLSHRNLVVVFGLVALAGLGAGRGAWRAIRPPRWSWPLFGLAAYLTLSTLWTQSAEDRDWGVRIPLFALGVLSVLAAARITPRRGAAGFGLSVAAACLLLGFEGATGGLLREVLPPTGEAARDQVATARGIGLAVVLLPASVLCLARRYGVRPGLAAGGIMTAGLAIGAVRFGVAANVLALLAGAVCAAAAAWRPRGVPAALLALVGVGFVAAPLAASQLPRTETLQTLEAGPLSWRQRLVIWRTVADAGTETPATLLFGAGQHGSDALGQRAGTIAMPGARAPLPRVPSHPHDIFLQVWYEAGVTGSLLAFAGFVLAGKRLRAVNAPRAERVAIAATLGAAAVFWAVDASLWTLWRGAALGLAAYAFSAASGPDQSLSSATSAATDSR